MFIIIGEKIKGFHCESQLWIFSLVDNKIRCEMITCDNEMSLWLETMKKDIPICSLHSIQEFFECAKKEDLDARYFPVVDCGFIVYKETTIFLTSEEGGTILSLDPMME